MGAANIAIGGDGQRAGAAVSRSDAVIAAADRGAGAGRHGESGGGGGIPRMDAVTAGGDIAIGGDGQRARAVVLRRDATTAAADRGAGAGRHGKIGAGISRKDSSPRGAGDIAVRGDGQRARAVVERLDAAQAADRGAGAGGHGESGAVVVRVDGVTAAAGDIAVGGDGQRAGAAVLRVDTVGAAADRRAGRCGHAESSAKIER